MRLYFIRHGQSANNALYAANGSDAGRVDDPLLTDLGVQQAHNTAAFLAGSPDPVDPNGETSFGITHLYTSLMRRSLATSSVIAGKLGVSWLVREDIHEVGGIYLDAEEVVEAPVRPGITRAEIAAIYPTLGLNDSVREEGWWNRPRETAEQALTRGRQALEALLCRHGASDDRVGIVSHGYFFVVLLAAVLEVETLSPVWFRMYNCGISRIDFTEKRGRTVVYTNLTDHLRDGLLTD